MAVVFIVVVLRAKGWAVAALRYEWPYVIVTMVAEIVNFLGVVLSRLRWPLRFVNGTDHDPSYSWLAEYFRGEAPDLSG